MRIGLIDVIDWQTKVDFEVGRPVAIEHPLLDLAAGLLAEHRYPGDLTSEADAWVTDLALALNAKYQPDFMFLDYAHIYLDAVFRPGCPKQHQENVKATFDQIKRFLQETDFTPVIVGLGEMGPMRGYIDVTGFDGLVSAGGMAPRYAGLYNPSQSDLDKFAELGTIERIVDRETFRADFGGIPEHYEQFPDYLLVAKDGYVFRGVGSMSRPLHKIPCYDTAVPLHTSLGTASSIVDVAELVLDGLRHRKVALILVEGVGCKTFPLNHTGISNTYRWHSYTSGDRQYLALTTGKHFTERPYNLAYRYYVADDEQKPYPFSGIYNEIPEDTIGERYHGKSTAVGNRGMLTNLASGADISLECFVRALYNHGAMAVLKV